MDPELWNHTMFGPKMAHLPRMIFFMENYYYNFHVPFGPFHYAKFKKPLRVNPELWRRAIFRLKMTQLLQMRIFSEKPVISFPCTFKSFPLCKISKKYLKRIQSYEYELFLDLKWLVCPERSENRLVNLSTFIHVCLHAKSQSQMSSINDTLTIKECWNLNSQEHFCPKL